MGTVPRTIKQTLNGCTVWKTSRNYCLNRLHQIPKGQNGPFMKEPSEKYQTAIRSSLGQSNAQWGALNGEHSMGSSQWEHSIGTVLDGSNLSCLVRSNKRSMGAPKGKVADFWDSEDGIRCRWARADHNQKNRVKSIKRLACSFHFNAEYPLSVWFQLKTHQYSHRLQPRP